MAARSAPSRGGHGGRKVLITGFPGLLPRLLARTLLFDDPAAELFVLTQPKFTERAQEFADSLPPAKRNRLRLVSGDILDMHLGLSSEEYAALSASVTDIFHLAEARWLGMPREVMFRINADGTRNVLELARDCPRLTGLHHFSTVFVSGNRRGVVTEDELDEGQGFRNAYEESKFQAEKIVRRHMGDLPITIYRLPIVVGDSRTGEIDRFQGPYYLGILIVSAPKNVPLPLPGTGVCPLHMAPCDYIVAAIAQLTAQPAARGRTFHLVDPNPLSTRRVYEIIAQHAGKRVPSVRINARLARAALKLPGLERRLRTPLAALDDLEHPAIYNSRNTLELLRGSDVTCPPFESYVDNLIQFTRDSFARRAGGAEAIDPLAASEIKGLADAEYPGATDDIPRAGD